MCVNQKGDISTLDGTSLKLVYKFTYLGSSVSSIEKDIDTRLTKAWTAIDRLSIMWKLNLTDKMKRSFFQAAVVSILLYGCTTWTLTKRLEKKLDGNYTRMLRAVLNKWQQHPTRHQLYGYLPPITKTNQARRTRHAGHCWRSKDELLSDVLLWTPAYGQSKAGRPARTYIQQLCEDTGCSVENLPEAMNDREGWRERFWDIRAGRTTWWWWWDILSNSTCLLFISALRRTNLQGYNSTIGRYSLKKIILHISKLFLSIYGFIYIYIYIPPRQELNYRLPWSNLKIPTSQHYGRTPTSTVCLNSKQPDCLRTWPNVNCQMTLFQNLQVFISLLGMTSLTLHPHFLSGVYYDNYDCLSFVQERKLNPMLCNWTKNRIVQSPTKLNDKI